MSTDRDKLLPVFSLLGRVISQWQIVPYLEVAESYEIKIPHFSDGGSEAQRC